MPGRYRGITQEDKRDLVLDEIIDKNLNVHQTDELIESLMTPIPVLEEPKSKMKAPYLYCKGYSNFYEYNQQRH